MRTPPTAPLVLVPCHCDLDLYLLEFSGERKRKHILTAVLKLNGLGTFWMLIRAMVCSLPG